MSLDESIENKKIIQSTLLEFLEGEANNEENYENFVKIITDQKINEDQYEFKLFLQLINIIGNNHQRTCNFLTKIEKILNQFKENIRKHFTNIQIFKLFENNKRILLFLIDEKIITIDEYIVSVITSDKYLEMKYIDYFSPEIKLFLIKKFAKKHLKQLLKLKRSDIIEKIKKEYADEFYEKRKEGENDDYLCKLIRLNDVKNFVSFVEKTKLSLQSYIQESIFETNPFLLKKKNINLIEYAAFFGSNEIIKYLQMNGVAITSRMMEFAIHSQNFELIKYLDEISSQRNEYEIVLKESMKCHHINISNFIIMNTFDNELNEIFYRFCVKYHNYCFFPKNLRFKSMFFYLCKFDYFVMVKLYLENYNININERNIKNIIV